LKITIYALGGGWGHLTRAAALARELLPQQATILSNNPHAAVIQAAMPELSIEPYRTPTSDVLIVDTFPRGLVGELFDAKAKRKVLIHRDLTPDYLTWAPELRRFVETTYDLILCPGELGPFADLPQARVTLPWLIRTPAPGLASEVLVCAAGNPDELAWYGETVRLLEEAASKWGKLQLARSFSSAPSLGGQVRCIAPELPSGCPGELWTRFWPAIDYIANAQVVIGGAGYNTVYECLATGAPLIARPWPRKYDRQRERVLKYPSITIVDTPAEAAEAAIRLLKQSPCSRPEFRNGAAEAVRIIQSIL
jgi:Glycosyltransferase family 28 C-terminal domain